MKEGQFGLRVMMLLSLVAAGVAAFIFLASDVQGQTDLEPEGSDLYPSNEYGWLTLYMHHVYERYTKGKESFDKGDMEMAESNLVVMELFLEASKGHLPDTLQDGKPFDKKGYLESIAKLTKFSEELRQNLKNKKWSDTPEGKLDPMMQTCVGCHAAYNIPTDFRIDSKLKVLTHLMHQIYDIYHLAGPLLTSQEWDKAKACFLVVRPYIEMIPQNVPEVNQDGEKLDKELFNKVYKQLKQFNDDKIKQLVSKSFEGGKPLPPPRVVMDNCIACHANAKIEPPW
jgi:hypothetical protein